MAQAIGVLGPPEQKGDWCTESSEGLLEWLGTGAHDMPGEAEVTGEEKVKAEVDISTVFTQDESILH